MAMARVDPVYAWRRLRMAADYPACNKDKSKWPADVVATCAANTPTGFGYSTAASAAKFFQVCASAACMRIAGIMKTDNPVECTRGYDVLLYKDILTPLDNACRLLNPPIAVDPSTPSATSAPAATAAPSSPAKTAQPSATTSKTKTPSTQRPDSAGGTSSSQGGESTPPPSDVSPTTSSRSGSSSPTLPPASSPATTLVPSSSQAASGSSSSSSSASSSRSSGSLPQNPSISDTSYAPEASDGTLQNSTSPTSSSSSPTGLIVGIVVGAVVLLGFMFVLSRRKSSRKNTHSTAKIEPSMTNTTAETATFPQEYASDFYNQLMALDNWRIDSSEVADGRLLGCGARGAIYLVTLDGGRRLASKRLVRDQLTENRLNSVIAEIELEAKLKHPAIVEFVGVAWTTPSDLQILFEYMPNGDLRTHLDQTKPSQPQPQPWTTEKLKHAVQVAEAIVYVHSFNPPVVHRDIKARNILLDDKMNAKLSDFGASRSLSEQATMTTGVGTSRWLAPEVIMGGGKYTEQCDIYSFGVLLVEMDSHAIPFADEKLPEIELLHRVATGALRPTLSAACDPLLRELILQCLSADPSARPNALELSYRLRKILEKMPTD